MLNSGMTNFFFESPYRISKTLEAIAQIAPESRMALIREATKFHEEIIRGTAQELAALKREWKGEFVIGLFNGKAASLPEDETR